jgi:hypothetical protein
MKVNVAAFDYTGYGLHEGTPSENACYDDVRGVYGTTAVSAFSSSPQQELNERTYLVVLVFHSAWLTLSKGIPSDKLIVYEHSTATAVQGTRTRTLSLIHTLSITDAVNPSAAQWPSIWCPSSPPDRITEAVS